MGAEDREVKKDSTPQEQAEEEILPSKFEALPPLKEGYVRIVHITDPETAEKIVKSGLHYGDSRLGAISSTARIFNRAEDMVYDANKDDRYMYPGAKAIFMDVPVDEGRLHNDPAKAPGIIPAKYIVGIINVNPEDRNFRVYKMVKEKAEFLQEEKHLEESKNKKVTKSAEIPSANSTVSTEDEIW